MEVQVGEYIVSVDAETAEKLKDPTYAASYAEAIKRHLARGNDVSIWRSSKCPTDQDHEATLTLLQLRKTLSNEFDDKKTPKMELWSKIAKTLNEQGFFVGEGVEGREKVRQKFANLYNSYVKYCDGKKRTGEGKLKVPKYYTEMDEILGDKHKINPIKVIDSAVASTSSSVSASDYTFTTDSSINDENESCGSTSKANVATRFQQIKRCVKPKSTQLTALQEIVNIQKQNQAKREAEFSTLLNVIKEQNQQRHEQLMAIISTMSKKNSKRKRPMKNKSSESDASE